MFGVILAKTQYGHLLYAVGGNAEISGLFGIPVQFVVGSTYVFSGFCVGTAASLSTSQLSYSASDQDPALVFDVIVAVVVGGTVTGRRGQIMWQTAVGTRHSRRSAKRPQLARYQQLLPIYYQRLSHHHRGQPRCLDTVALG